MDEEIAEHVHLLRLEADKIWEFAKTNEFLDYSERQQLKRVAGRIHSLASSIGAGVRSAL